MRPDTGDVRRALEPFGVSRETESQLVHFVEMLNRWQRTHNLVSATSLDQVWSRHVADSAQLAFRFREGGRWLDLGSGAGFPGIVIAIMIANRSGAHVHLVEADRKKAAFLSVVSAELGLPTTVLAERIESVVQRWSQPLDWVSVRGLAPLKTLCEWLEPLVGIGAHAVLLKGANFDVELSAIESAWDIDLVRYPSLIDSHGSVVEIRRLKRRSGNRTGGQDDNSVRIQNGNSSLAARDRARQPEGRRRQDDDGD